MKKDILFLCQFFYPEYVSSAVLPFDTAKFLAAHGLSVDVLSGYPKEYSKEKRVLSTETVEGIEIKRIRYIQMARDKRVGRLVNYFSFTASVLLHLPLFRKYRNIIVYSNPPVLPLIAVLSNILFGARIVFVAYDVYPEIAYASNTIRPGNLIDRGMRLINRMMYKRVSRVVALTDEMKSFIAENRPEVDVERITIIANWAHENVREANQDVYKRFGYTEDHLVVSYFGNMGVCQDMDTLMDAAVILKDHPRIRFLIIGHGSKKDHVLKIINENRLVNVQLLEFLSGDDFEQASAVSSCGVVSLEEGLIGTCAPSKYYSYLKGGKPVLAIAEKGSYIQEEIEREQIGHFVSNGESSKLSDAILHLVEDPLERNLMGVRARVLYQRQYEQHIGLKKYVDLFCETATPIDCARSDGKDNNVGTV